MEIRIHDEKKAFNLSRREKSDSSALPVKRHQFFSARTVSRFHGFINYSEHESNSMLQEKKKKIKKGGVGGGTKTRQL